MTNMTSAEAGGHGAPVLSPLAAKKIPAVISDWLGLAAAPSFAIMALLASVIGDGAPDVLCSAAHASLLGGMVPMYLLMSVFHLAPWLKLVSRYRLRSAPPRQ